MNQDSKRYIEYIKDHLEVYKEITDLFFSIYGVHNYVLDLDKPVDLGSLQTLGYVMFMQRFRANSESMLILINSVNEDNVDFIEHSMGIIHRANLLDCLYIFAWKDNRELIKCLIADSYQNALNRKDLWGFDQKSIDSIKELAKFFKDDCKFNDLSAKKMVEVTTVKKQAKMCYQFYDLYSKYDHFGLTIGTIFDDNIDKLIENLFLAMVFVAGAMHILVDNFELNTTNKNRLMAVLKREPTP